MLPKKLRFSEFRLRHFFSVILLSSFEDGYRETSKESKTPKCCSFESVPTTILLKNSTFAGFHLTHFFFP